MNVWPSGLCNVNLRLTPLSAQLLLVCLVLPSSDTIALHSPPLVPSRRNLCPVLERFHAPSALPHAALNRKQQTVITGEWQSVEAVFVHAFYPAPKVWGNKEPGGSKGGKKNEIKLKDLQFLQVSAHEGSLTLLHWQSDTICVRKMPPSICFHLNGKEFWGHFSDNLTTVTSHRLWVRSTSKDFFISSLWFTSILADFWYCFWMIRGFGILYPWPSKAIFILLI